MVWCRKGREGMCEEVWSVSNPSKIFFRTTYTAEKFHGKKSDTNLRSAFRAFLTCSPDGAPRSDREIDQRALTVQHLSRTAYAVQCCARRVMHTNTPPVLLVFWIACHCQSFHNHQLRCCLTRRHFQLSQTVDLPRRAIRHPPPWPTRITTMLSTRSMSRVSHL